MLTRADLAGRKKVSPMHLYLGGGKGAWTYGVEGLPRLGAFDGWSKQRKKYVKIWSVDGTAVRDLDAALAVLNGTMTLEEAMPQPDPPKQPEPKRKFSIDQQIGEVDYELRQRAGVYARAVSKGSMRQSEADYHVEGMKAVLATLEWCRDNRETIAKVHAEAKAAQTQKDPPPAEAEGGSISAPNEACG